MGLKTLYRVRVGGLDISSRLAPFLISLEVDLSDEPEGDTARIVLADSMGRLQMPRERAPVEVELGREGGGTRRLFSGFVEGATGEGARGSGRELHISCTSMDGQGKAKQPLERHFDNMSVGDALRKAAKDAGISLQVHPQFASMMRSYLSLDGQSFVDFGRQLASEVGATFKVHGERGLFVPRNAGLSATGRPLTPIRAVAGENLLRWSLSPVRGRPRWQSIRTRTWDPKKARWTEKEEQVAGTAADAVLSVMHPAADEGSAGERSKAGAAESERNKGEGNLLLIGDAAAQPAAPVPVIGTRPGLDGTYQAARIRHNVTRGQGWVMSVDVRRPQGAEDGRKSAA